MKTKTLASTALVLAGVLAAGSSLAIEPEYTFDPLTQLVVTRAEAARLAAGTESKPTRSGTALDVSQLNGDYAGDPVWRIVASNLPAPSVTGGVAPERAEAKTLSIDGYTTTLHVMQNARGETHGRNHKNHNLMVKFSLDGKTVQPTGVEAVVRHPSREQRSYTLEPMGEWYMADWVDLQHVEGHALELQFTGPDGQSHSGTVYLN